MRIIDTKCGGMIRVSLHRITQLSLHTPGHNIFFCPALTQPLRENNCSSSSSWSSYVIQCLLHRDPPRPAVTTTYNHHPISSRHPQPAHWPPSYDNNSKPYPETRLPLCSAHHLGVKRRRLLTAVLFTRKASSARAVRPGTLQVQ